MLEYSSLTQELLKKDSLFVRCKGNKNSSCCWEPSHNHTEASFRVKCGRQTQISGDDLLPIGLLKRYTTFWTMTPFFPPHYMTFSPHSTLHKSPKVIYRHYDFRERTLTNLHNTAVFCQEYHRTKRF